MTNTTNTTKRLDDWQTYICALIYPIQFEADPIQATDRILELVRTGALGASSALYLASVRMALSSHICLASLIPQDHPEAAIRRFLAELEPRLAATVDEERK